MGDDDQDGLYDRFMTFNRAVTGATFFVPSLEMFRLSCNDGLPNGGANTIATSWLSPDLGVRSYLCLQDWWKAVIPTSIP